MITTANAPGVTQILFETTVLFFVDVWISMSKFMLIYWHPQGQWGPLEMGHYGTSNQNTFIFSELLE
jgi:hypothetical protein